MSRDSRDMKNYYDYIYMIYVNLLTESMKFNVYIIIYY